MMKTRLLFISSSGGHLTQLLKIHKEYDLENTILITEKNPTTVDLKNNLISKILYLPHGGRENLLIFLFKFSYNTIISLYRIIKYKPKIVISTGANTAVPTCVIAKMFSAKIIYVETFAKMETPTITGRIIHLFADSFYVQWESLLKFYKKAKFVGRLY